MPEHVVKTKFTADDRISKSFRDMTRNARRFRSTMGSVIGANMATGAISRGLGLIERGVAGVVTEVVDLDQALTGASAKFGSDIQRGTEGYKRLEKTAREVGATTEFTAAEAAKGLDFLAMAGFNYEQSLTAITPLTDLATAAQMDLARASDIASDSLGAFGLMSDDPAQLATNLGRVNDVFAKTVTTSNTTMETLFETISESGPAVKAAGGEIETFAALAGQLGSAGIKGSKAGTNLKNMFLRLAAPVPKANKLLRKLGVETVDKTTGNMRDMIDIIRDLNTETKDMGTAQRAAALDTLFGKRAISGASVLLDLGADKLEAYREQLIKSKGASKDMADEMRTGLGNQLKVLQSVSIDKGMQIFSKIMGETDPAEAVAKLAENIKNFDVGPLAEKLREIFNMVKEGTEWIWENREAIWSATKAYTKFKVAMAGMHIANTVTSLIGLAAGFGNVGTSATAATASVGGMMGKLQMIGPAIAGFGAGWAIGGLINTHIVNPIVEAREKLSLEVDNMSTILARDMKKMGIAELEANKQKFVARHAIAYGNPAAVVSRMMQERDINREIQRKRVAMADRINAPATQKEQSTSGIETFLSQSSNAPVMPAINNQINPEFEVNVNVSTAEDGTTTAAAEVTPRNAPSVNTTQLGPQS